MAKYPLLQLGVFLPLLSRSVFGSVPSATNISVVCHNFVNVLYWNYSNPDDQTTFTVNISSYEGYRETVSTSQTFLDVSHYSSDAMDNYLVSVTTHVGRETSESSFIEFTYSKDYFEEKKTKCSLDFPPVNASVHKDVIEVSFKHPFSVYKQEALNDEFVYTVSVNQTTSSHSCFEDEDEVENLCIAKIHLNQAAAGQCVDVKFDGKISTFSLYTYRNVCVPLPVPESDHTNLIIVFICGGIVMFFIIVGVVWFLWNYLSKIPKLSEFMPNIVPGVSPTVLISQPEQTPVSRMTSVGHTALLADFPDSSPTSVFEEDSKTGTTFVEIEKDEPESSEENYDSSGDFAMLSDYDRPKFLQEMSPGDFTEGYGPRPPVL